MKNNRSLGLIKHFEENKIVLRIAALIIDYCFIALIYGAITTFLLKLDLISLETIISNENNSLYMFLIYLFLSIGIFKTTLGMRTFRLKIVMNRCRWFTAFIRVFTIPFYVLNIFFLAFKRRCLQDIISDSKIIKLREDVDA